MEGVFIFDDIIGVQNNVINYILGRVNTDDLTKALIREDEKIRKLFYRNMELDALKELDKKLKTTDAFTGQDKKMAQKKILDLVAQIPEYHDTRFESGFIDTEEFEKYLLSRHQPEKKYGMFEKDISICRFFESKNADKILEDIRAKNEAENMGNIRIPNTNIQLINYSICPKCSHIFSYKDLSDYYLKPRPDPLFRNKSQQLRQDTRVFCHDCGTYFLPSLVINDGTPKSEVQFLCRIQTMEAIESYYGEKGAKVLSRRGNNLIYKNNCYVPGAARDSIFRRRKEFTENARGIKNDVFITEMTEKPTLITNLIQYTPTNLVINLIEGSNVRKGDLLFGEL